MYLKHKIYGKFFNVFTKFPINNRQISFIIDSNKSFKGNLDYIKKEFEKRGDFQFNFFYKDKLSFSNFKKLATSKYVFLNDNFFPLAFMDFKKDTKVIQLWHAPGAFKKFGASVDGESKEMIKEIGKNIDYLITSADSIKPFYSEAFQIDTFKIKALGLPRADYYFKNHDLNKLRENFDSKYHLAKNKKIVLYAPTFRDNSEDNNVFNFLDLEKFNKELGDDYVLVLRLHPKIKKFFKNQIEVNQDYIDCTDFDNEQELLLISDVLISDYSSIMIEFAMLFKPIIFFTYDFDNYVSDDRGFYFDFKQNVPGPIVYTTDELISEIKNNNFDKNRISKFLETQFNPIDGCSSKRIVDFLLNEGEENG
ncbi:CDP-glycerol glycerophosphotransferase family protein [uncultured Methanobrevibacter sp.]|uniref:CDP-glycerol glycerophosphotransferase family protein n=1 Tax=uncultured Methanobrevibacter sp. TaxID=253161 RepID=UPI002610D651|nr:CDP-glycerol glycerophosphotransferase family protein [uncultured Methanobrevibacter sp.]